MERVDLHEVIRYAAAMCEGDVQARELTLTLRLDATESFVRGDATRLQQVFWNLIRNAVRYTPNGGQVGVHTSRESNGGCLSVDVSDTGRGIAAEDLERVFQPFEQAGSQQAGGLGLGLAICRGLVEAHGGMIRAQSEGLDRGATFNVELPRSADPASAQLGAAARKRGGSAALRVLLVEDNRDTAEALGVLLQLEGYEVDVAYTVDDARRLAQAGFDVLLSDLQLPDGSGLELMRELASEGEVHGIAMSGFGALADLQRSREAGFEAHLVKPVEFAKVLEAIEDVAPRG
jgi:CheY-like chemotaxis protein